MTKDSKSLANKSSNTNAKNKSNQSKLKLFEFEFRPVFEHRKCFGVFLDQAVQDFNSDIVIMFTHLEWFQAMAPERMDLFDRLISLSAAKCESSRRAFQEVKNRVIQEEFARLDIQPQSEERYVSTIGSGREDSGDDDGTTTSYDSNNNNNNTVNRNASPSSTPTPIVPPASPKLSRSTKLFSRSRSTLAPFNGNHNGGSSGNTSPISPLSPVSRHKLQEMFSLGHMSIDDQIMAQLCNMCELYAHCVSLIATFLTVGTPHEVNISNSIRSDLMHRWNQFVPLYRRSVEAIAAKHITRRCCGNNNRTMGSDASSNQSCCGCDRSGGGEQLFDSAYELKIHCAQIFKDCRLALEVTLSDDIFPRFKRCKRWETFVQSCSMEELNQFGETKATLFLEPLKMSCDDMVRPTITPKDVALARILLKDFYHWKPMTQKKLASYYSNITFLKMEALTQYGHLNAYKSSYEYDASAKQFMQMFLSQEYYPVISDMEVNFVTYIPMAVHERRECGDGSESSSTDDVSTLRLAVNRMNQSSEIHKRIINYGSTVSVQRKISPLIKREFIQTCTVFYEPSDRTYYYVYKYCEHKDLPEMRKGLTRGISFGVTSFAESAGKCRVDSVFMVNLKGIMSSKSEKPGFLARKGIARHIKHTTRKIEGYMEEARRVNFELGDGLQMRRPLGEFLSEFHIDSSRV